MYLLELWYLLLPLVGLKHLANMLVKQFLLPDWLLFLEPNLLFLDIGDC